MKSGRRGNLVLRIDNDCFRARGDTAEPLRREGIV
jgi:hypothetical protein